MTLFKVTFTTVRSGKMAAYQLPLASAAVTCEMLAMRCVSAAGDIGEHRVFTCSEFTLKTNVKILLTFEVLYKSLYSVIKVRQNFLEKERKYVIVGSILLNRGEGGSGMSHCSQGCHMES